MRELRNVVERACMLSDGEFLTERELVASMPPSDGPSMLRPSVAFAPRVALEHGAADSDSLASVERDHIQRALAKAGGNKKVAAQMLGLSRRALYRRLERLDLVDSISRRRDSELAAAGA